MGEEEKFQNRIGLRKSIRSLWHSLRKIKILSYFTEALFGTYLFYVIRFFIDKACHYCDKSKAFFQENKERVEKIKSKLSDDRSRLIYESMINFRCTHNPKYTYKKGIMDKVQYFDKDLIKLGSREVFVDCGAFTGDTIKEFLKKLRIDGGKFKEIIAIRS